MTIADDTPMDIFPMLRRDAVLIPRDGSGLLRTEREAVLFRGTDAYRLLVRLRPYLTGRRSLEEICADLAGPQREVVSAVVRGLLDRGIVIDAGPDLLARPAEPGAADRFQAQLGYLAHVINSPAPAFMRFRETRILVIGNGISMHAAAAGLLRNGAARLVVAPTEASWPYAGALRGEVARLRSEGVTAHLRIDRRARPGDSYGLVVYCADRGGPAPVGDLIRGRRTGDAPLLAMTVVDGRGVFGPLTRPGIPGCWCCVSSRLGSGHAAAPAPLTPTVARMLGGAVAFEAFRLLTGVPSDDVIGAAVVQDLRTLQAGRFRVAAGCPACGDTGPSAGPPAVRADPGRGTVGGPAVMIVDDMPSPTVQGYADAVHRVARSRLPPTGWVPDFGDRPPLLTSYPAAPLIALPDVGAPRERAFAARRSTGNAPYTIDRLAWLLRASYGPRARRLRFDSTQSHEVYGHYPTAQWRRGAVSGGGLYPLELYWVAGAGGPLEPGTYHYAPGHHALERLAEGDAGDRVRQAVRHPSAEGNGQFLLISLRFWRNAFKYANLAYHIGTMDLGALLGSLDQLGAGVGLPVRPLLWFDDEDLNALLGLDTDDESVLAVVPMPWEDMPARLPQTATPGGARVPAPPSVPEPFETSRTILRFAWTRQVHHSTLLAGQRRPATHHPQPVRAQPPSAGRPTIALPDVATLRPDESVGGLLGRRRSSFGGLADMPPITLGALGSVLNLTTRTGRFLDDLVADHWLLCWTRLSVLVSHVAGVESGGYRYDPVDHTLCPVGPAVRWPDVLSRIGVALANYTLDQAAAILVISGRPDAMVSRYGPRGYRMLNAEVGSVVQAGYLAATAVGLGCGAVLNLDHPAIDDVLGFAGTDERAILCLLVGGECDGSADFDDRLS